MGNNYSDAYLKTKPCEPYFWEKHKLTVIRDGHDEETGQRIHFVKEPGHEGSLIDNAAVFTIKEKKGGE